MKSTIDPIDWQKLFLGLGMSIVLTMQAYQQSTQNQHGVQISDIAKSVVPRSEVETTYVPHHEITKSQKELEVQIGLLTKALEKLATGVDHGSSND